MTDTPQNDAPADSEPLILDVRAEDYCNDLNFGPEDENGVRWIEFGEAERIFKDAYRAGADAAAAKYQAEIKRLRIAANSIIGRYNPANFPERSRTPYERGMYEAAQEILAQTEPSEQEGG